MEGWAFTLKEGDVFTLFPGMSGLDELADLSQSDLGEIARQLEWGGSTETPPGCGER